MDKRILSKIILILLVVLSGTIGTSAQLRYGFRFGGDIAKARLGNASILSNAVPVTSDGTQTRIYQGEPGLVNRSGFSGGLVLEYQFTKCGFAPDIALLYTRYNTRLRLPGDKPRSFGRNFIEIPIHFKWKFWIPQTKNLFAPMIYTGPSLMFRVGHNSGISYGQFLGTASSHMDIYAIPYRTGIDVNYFKTDVFQPGWDVGIGFDIINFIQVTAGYRFGLGNALYSPRGTKDNLSLRTDGWTIAATLLFDF